MRTAQKDARAVSRRNKFKNDFYQKRAQAQRNGISKYCRKYPSFYWHTRRNYL